MDPDSEFEPVIGLEVHAELQTQSKMFCACPVIDSTSAAPNSAICEICTGMPGTLPVLNARAVDFAVKVALALGCTIAPRSVFARKNYFYPDLPKGYQISQYELPLAREGRLEIVGAEGTRAVRVRRVHLEEDTAKLFHRDGYSLIDYNRSGVPLLEIVSEPDLYSLEDVRAYATELRSLLRYLEVNSGDMERGVIRFEANVSIRPRSSSALGTRTEIKNLNSFRSMVRSLGFELERQEARARQGLPVLQETLGWDETRGETFPQRGKEEAHDYRYFPEPDLPVLVIDSERVERLRRSLPELPSAKRARFVRQHGLTPYLAKVLSAERSQADFFEEAVRSEPSVPPERIGQWMAGELYGLLNEQAIAIEACRFTPAQFAELVRLVQDGTITPPTGKTILAEMFASGAAASDVVRSRGLQRLSDRSEIEALVKTLLEAHPDQLELYLKGKRTLAQWFFGQVMRAAGGRADPHLVQEALDHALKSAENRHASP